MPELSETLNVYVDGGKTYHRVTSIISAIFPDEYKEIDAATLDNAADRGHASEALCVEYLINGYVDCEVRADAVPRLEAFIRWAKKHDVQYVGHQQTVFRDDVAGTIDLFLCVDGVLTIADIKCCASKMRTWPIQVGGYAWMKRCDQVGILQLHPSLNKQGFRWYTYDTEKAIGYWLSVYHFWKLTRQLNAL